MTAAGRRGTLSAMVRVRNEADFLEASIRSVAPHVDEVVIVDNGSDDDTPSIVGRLAAEAPEKVKIHVYRHRVRKVGRETWRLAEDRAAADSPRLSSNFYNWCLDRCSMDYVIKWDGDMIALPALSVALTAWRESGREVLVFHGANVHPNRTHLVKARCGDREELLRGLSVPALPRWVTSLTYDHPEPRLYPRAGARYTNRILWTQELSAPAYNGPEEGRSVHRADGPLYLHMKFCKTDPMANYSDDLAGAIWSNLDVGPPLDEDWRRVLASAGGRTGP